MLICRAGDFIGHASGPCEKVLLLLFLWIDLRLWGKKKNTLFKNIKL